MFLYHHGGEGSFGDSDHGGNLAASLEEMGEENERCCVGPGGGNFYGHPSRNLQKWWIFRGENP